MAGSLVFGVVNHFVLASPGSCGPGRAAVAAAFRDDSGAARADRGARTRPGDPSRPRKDTGVMNVFVAGGSGTIGIPLVRALVAAGHQVTALTRFIGKRDELRAAGRVRGCCGRAESRGPDRGRRGRSSDTHRSSIDRAAEGRTASPERSRRDQPAAHRRHAQSPRRRHSRRRPAIRRRLVCHAVGSGAGRVRIRR